MFSKEILVKTIKQTSKEWLYDPSDFVSYLDINSGSCGEFAEDVFERLPSDSGVKIVTTGDFMEGNGLYFGKDNTFSNHVWLMFNEEHFDIERPDGVKDFMDLPFFKREVKMKELGVNERELYQLIVKNKDKYSDLIASV